MHQINTQNKPGRLLTIYALRSQIKYACLKDANLNNDPHYACHTALLQELALSTLHPHKTLVLTLHFFSVLFIFPSRFYFQHADVSFLALIEVHITVFTRGVKGIQQLTHQNVRTSGCLTCAIIFKYTN